MSDKTIFAVYGTLKNGYMNQIRTGLNTAKFLGEFVSPPNYTMLDGGYPIVEREGDTSIHCELYETDNERVINSVFQLEGCSKTQGHQGNWYDFDKVKTPYGEAVMFVMNKGANSKGNTGYGRKVLPSGKWGK